MACQEGNWNKTGDWRFDSCLFLVSVQKAYEGSWGTSASCVIHLQSLRLSNRAFLSEWLHDYQNAFTFVQDIKLDELKDVTNRTVDAVNRSYQPRRRFRRHDALKLKDEVTRVQSTLLEYGRFRLTFPCHLCHTIDDLDAFVSFYFSRGYAASISQTSSNESSDLKDSKAQESEEKVWFYLHC